MAKRIEVQDLEARVGAEVTPADASEVTGGAWFVRIEPVEPESSHKDQPAWAVASSLSIGGDRAPVVSLQSA